MLGGAPDHLDAALPGGRDVGVALQQLGVAQHGVERRAQLVAEADHVAALGEIRGLGDLLGLLQGRVGAPVRRDLLQQQRRLPGGFLLRHAPALRREDEEPGQDA